MDLGVFEELVGACGFAQRESLRYDWLNLAISEKVKEFGEIFAELLRVGVATIFYVVPACMLSIRQNLHQAKESKA